MQMAHHTVRTFTSSIRSCTDSIRLISPLHLAPLLGPLFWVPWRGSRNFGGKGGFLRRKNQVQVKRRLVLASRHRRGRRRWCWSDLSSSDFNRSWNYETTLNTGGYWALVLRGHVILEPPVEANFRVHISVVRRPKQRAEVTSPETIVTSWTGPKVGFIGLVPSGWDPIGSDLDLIRDPPLLRTKSF